MLMKLSLFICIVCAFVLVGCSKSETTANNSAANANKPAASTPATASTSPAASSSAEKIGVPECDDFIAKYDACVSSHVPENVRAQYRTSIATWRTCSGELIVNCVSKPPMPFCLVPIGMLCQALKFSTCLQEGQLVV